jgi:hypothetical protein
MFNTPGNTTILLAFEVGVLPVDGLQCFHMIFNFLIVLTVSYAILTFYVINALVGAKQTNIKSARV